MNVTALFVGLMLLGGPTTIDKVACLGFDNCQRISNGTVEIVVTTEVGPRIARYAIIGGPNALAEFRKPGAPKPDPGRFSLYGGHRLWAGPEDHKRTYHPDNAPVQWSQPTSNQLKLVAPVESTTGLQKTLTVTLEPTGTRVTIDHQITNRSKRPVTLTVWPITVMPANGTALIPNEPATAHADSRLPVRNIALWGYADMSDGRVIWGKHYLRVTPLGIKAPFKLGIENQQGWVAHRQPGQVFIKRFPHLAGRQYSDRNSNFELFTNGDFMELESLSPLQKLAPGQNATHQEQWQLFDKLELPADDEGIERVLRPLL
jgi:Domain of unknown function (DUF4380)